MLPNPIPIHLDKHILDAVQKLIHLGQVPVGHILLIQIMQLPELLSMPEKHHSG
jgi:hypothetical protein